MAPTPQGITTTDQSEYRVSRKVKYRISLSRIYEFTRECELDTRAPLCELLRLAACRLSRTFNRHMHSCTLRFSGSVDTMTVHNCGLRIGPA